MEKSRRSVLGALIKQNKSAKSTTGGTVLGGTDQPEEL